jgi:Na+/H+ antiporter NhaC
MNKQLYSQLMLLFFPLLFFSQTTLGKSQVVFPAVVVSGIEHYIEVLLDNDSIKYIDIQVNGVNKRYVVSNQKLQLPYTFKSKEQLVLKSKYFSASKIINPIPLWISIIPPLLAIFMALLFKEVISSLFVGILFGTLTIQWYAEESLWLGMMHLIDVYIMGALNDWGHLAIILFSTLIGGMVAVISRNGGMHGVVEQFSNYAKNAKSSQLITWLMGILIFFDDYANTLIVGNTMRPLTDKHRVSREKLSYLVDSTAAPIAAIAFVTTWIGAELGYIEDGIKAIGVIEEGAYTVFLHSLQFSFYPIFTLLFMLMLILKQRDFGPMLKAERLARSKPLDEREKVELNDEVKHLQPKLLNKRRWYNAAVPVVVIILGTIAGLLYTGWDDVIVNDSSLSFFRKLSAIIGGSDSYLALLWSSLFGLMVSILMTVSQKIMTLSETLETSMSGFKTMLNAIVILVLAWSLALLTQHLHTANFLTGILANNMTVVWIPALTFVLSAIVAFATGSSWGTMAILYPLMLPATWRLGMESGLNPVEIMALFYNVVASVLAGSVLGDHCSPISDTTILSSLATSCNHLRHVRTQMPYALTVGAVSLLVGTIPTSFGLPPFISFVLGLILLYTIVHYAGKNSEMTKENRKSALS